MTLALDVEEPVATPDAPAPEAPVPGPATITSPHAASAEESDVVSSLQWDADTRSRLAGELPEQRRGVTVVLCTYKRAKSVERFLASLARQTLKPDALLIVDASPDGETEEVLAGSQDARAVPSVSYWRVRGGLAGLTRQRNFGLRFVEHDLVAFFDDDVVLAPACLERMERAMRERPDAVGVGASVSNESRRPSALWRFRRALRIVPDLTPGRYTRTGMSIPWSFLEPRAGCVEGDWLPGCGMMWRSSPARSVGFFSEFAGYAQGEDLDFSLRMRPHGKLLLACDARLQHLHDASGRPDGYRIGYMAIANRWQIHRRGLADRTPRDAARFVYAWGLDTLLMARHLLVPARWKRVASEMAGRTAAVRDIARGGPRVLGSAA